MYDVKFEFERTPPLKDGWISIHPDAYTIVLDGRRVHRYIPETRSLQLNEDMLPDSLTIESLESALKIRANSDGLSRIDLYLPFRGHKSFEVREVSALPEEDIPVERRKTRHLNALLSPPTNGPRHSGIRGFFERLSHDVYKSA